ncbi:hypothetical protein [Paenibacillus sp. USDA918EY]|uniref:hypothetical protein n=1 Tax=Paenibacillus sp. USDA918EY TaxID=2689575 RepID=UPI00135B2A35|nr:hypothetical protein [Paenibacillus sp. USDA918EY]
MSVKVKKNKVQADGREYQVGEIITDLDEKEEQRLITLGVCEAAPSLAEPKQEPAGTSTETDNDALNLPLKGLVLTVEQFAELKADEQKVHLKSLEIDPAGKEEDRVAQYDEWYTSQVTDGGSDAQL